MLRGILQDENGKYFVVAVQEYNVVAWNVLINSPPTIIKFSIKSTVKTKLPFSCQDNLSAIRFNSFPLRCRSEMRFAFVKPLSRSKVMSAVEWDSKRVRATFLDYFVKSKEHTFVPSSSTIPHNDPSLLFANSGMTQFKPIFQGTQDPNHYFATLKRAANSQKCIRAGGKHNDLDDVGKDTYHHTFFEMLGNWSFGDYFKAEAISMAWDLLTNVYKLPKERLYVTYFAGNPSLNLQPDNEARELWIKIGIDEKRVIPYGMKENFWEMGECGPCGPCSEIHFDRIGGRDASALVNADDPTVIEIWNLVFMQFNREPDGSLKVLPMKHVDTGMGFERLVSVLQNKMSNYDTDVFTPIFDQIQCRTGAPDYTGKVGKDDVTGIDTAYRVVADHIRTLTFAISDGGVPSNEGRGYVLRRILRRGVRYAYEKLGAKPGFFASMIDVVIEQMGDVFPEITKNPNNVRSILEGEEEQFRKTLDRGLIQFSKFVSGTEGGKYIKGEDAWRLFDTFGFPLDLTKLMAEERGLFVDEAGYAVAQEKAREISKGVKSLDESLLTESSNEISSFDLDIHALSELSEKMKIAKTDDSSKYHTEDLEASVTALYHSGAFVSSISSKEPSVFGVILDRTNFYAEQGGQLFDTGILSVTTSDGKTIGLEVLSVKTRAGYVLHVCQFKQDDSIGKGEKQISLGNSVTCSFNLERRKGLRQNHTATHLLNFAIRSVCTDEQDPEQKGSYVAPDKLRFDFCRNKPVDCEQLSRIQQLVNEMIQQDLPVYAKDVSLQEASKITGIRMVFGESYPDPVRVVSIGINVDKLVSEPENPQWLNYAIELCGGTHSLSIGELERFVITQETTKAKGTRRIFAITGSCAVESEVFEKLLQERLDDLDLFFKAESLKLTEHPSSTDLSVLSSSIEEDLKKLAKDLDDSSIDAVKKHDLRCKLVSIRSQFDDHEKARKARQIKQVEKQVTDNLQSNDSHLVIKLECDPANGKALSSAMSLLKQNSRSACVYCFDESTGKVAFGCYSTAVSPIDWLSQLKPFMEDFKCGGGKQGAAQGTGTISCSLETIHQSLVKFIS